MTTTAPEPQAPQTLPPRKRNRGRLYVILGAVAAVVVAAVVIVVVVLGGSKPPQPVHGQVLGGTSAGATVAEAVGGAHGICAGAVAGTQVVIKGPSGTLLAATTLQPSGAQATGQVGVYRFDTTIPAGSGPYTVDLVGVNSVVVNASDLAHLQLTCG